MNEKCLILLLLLGLLACKPSDIKRNKTMKSEITYWSNEGETTLPNELLIANDGETVLKIRSNRTNTEYSNAGIYRAHFEEARFLSLANALRNEEFVRLQDPQNLPPGIALRKLSIKEHDKTMIEKFTTGAIKTPPVFQAAEKLALDLVATTRKTPYQAISIQVDQLPAQFNSGDTVNFSVTLTNVGSQSIQIPHPANWDDYSAQMILKALRSDIPLAELRARHQKFETLSKDTMSEIKARKVQGPMITLVPSDKITMLLQKKFDWDNGNYDADISCLLPLFDTDGKEVIRCEIVSKKINMKCL